MSVLELDSYENNLKPSFDPIKEDPVTTGAARKTSYAKLQNERWEELVYRWLTVCKRQHKSNQVPDKYKMDPELGSWVVKLSIEQIDILVYIGFASDPYQINR